MHLDDLTIKKGWIQAFPERTVAVVNGLNSYVFITLLLWLFFFRFALNVNEEHYLALAKQFYNPDWIAHSFSLTEFAGSKVLYQYIVGFFLNFLPFEIVAAGGRVLLSLAIAYPLMLLYKVLRLSNIDVLLHLPILYFPNQSFFGQEWIFVTLESKGLAYFFVLFALYYTLREKYRYAMLFAVAATYFHILVGGWYAVYCCLHHLANKKSLRKTIPLGLLFLVSLIPLLYYLAPILRDNFAENSVGNLDWIFTYFRQPHHTALFLSIPYFVKEHLGGVLLSLTFFSICLLVYRRIDEDWVRKMNLFNMLMFSGTFLCLILAYFDRTGAFVKYFPFRINALFAFLVLLQTVYIFKHFFLKKELLKSVQFGVLVWFFFAIFPRTSYSLFTDIKQFATSSGNPPEFEEICDYIRTHTDREDVLLLLSKYTDANDFESYEVTPSFKRSFMRQTQRDLFVSFSFAPIAGGTGKLQEWYERLHVKQKILLDHLLVCQANKENKIDYMVTDFPLEGDACWQLSFQNGVYYLYRIS